MKRIALVAAAATLAAACALAPAAAAAAATSQCFRSTQVHATRPDGDSTLYVRAAGDKMFRVDMKEPCFGLDGTLGPLIWEPVGSGMICKPLDVNLTIGGHGQRCRIATITPLSRDEAAALPPRLKP